MSTAGVEVSEEDAPGIDAAVIDASEIGVALCIVSVVSELSMFIARGRCDSF